MHYLTPEGYYSMIKESLHIREYYTKINIYVGLLITFYELHFAIVNKGNTTLRQYEFKTRPDVFETINWAADYLQFENKTFNTWL